MISLRNKRNVIGIGMLVCFTHVINLVYMSLKIFFVSITVSLFFLLLTAPAILYIILSYYVLTKLLPHEENNNGDKKTS